MPRYTKIRITGVGLLAAVAAGCGGGVSAKSDPVAYVPSEHGLPAAVAAASHPRPAGFPAPRGRTCERWPCR
jgi:hypothetical protein